MNRKLRLLAAGMFFALGTCLFAESGKAKIIHHGWNSPTLKEMAENTAKFEEEAPFDGLVFNIGLNPVIPQPMTLEQFKGSIDLYKSINFQKYKNNFLLTLIDQNDPLWFDDASWEIIARNWGVAAEVVKETGAVGILFDPECYGTWPVSNYWKSEFYTKTDKKHSAAEYKKIARERGRQMGKAMFEKNPKLLFFGLYLYSFNADLLGELCNGILDVMPPDAALIDGDEWRGYCAKDKDTYKALEKNNKNGYDLLAREHKKKARTQLLFAPAFYMDAYARPDKVDCLHPTIFKEKPVRMFSQNFRAAKSASDGYVWIYGEKGTWWSAYNNKSDLWEKQLPGIQDVLFKKK